MRILVGVVGVTGLAFGYAVWDQHQDRIAAEARAVFVRDSIAAVAHAESLATVERQHAARVARQRAAEQEDRQRELAMARLRTAGGAELARINCSRLERVVLADGKTITRARTVPPECG
jgi:hypothetical protein